MVWCSLFWLRFILSLSFRWIGDFFNICPLYNNLHFIHFANYPVDKFNIFGMFLKRSDVKVSHIKVLAIGGKELGITVLFSPFQIFL